MEQFLYVKISKNLYLQMHALSLSNKRKEK